MPVRGILNVKNAITEMTADKDEQLKVVWTNAITRIKNETPYDRGVTINNWFYTTGSPSGERLSFGPGADGIPVSPIEEMPMFMFGERHYFTNNLPQIQTLEYGGYPDPVKKGSWRPMHKRKDPSVAYEIRSIGGYSKQAPKGWVRQNIRRLRQAIKKI